MKKKNLMHKNSKEYIQFNQQISNASFFDLLKSERIIILCLKFYSLLYIVNDIQYIGVDILLLIFLFYIEYDFIL
jgi:hypothetical protein